MNQCKEEVFLEEKKYLEEVSEAIENEINFQKNELKEIPKKHTNVLQGDSFLVEGLMNIASDRIRQLENVENSPYFGKIKFEDSATGEEDIVYIGRTTIKDGKGNLKLTDWRSPICSLYYDSEVGKVSYEAPQGIIHGNMNLKRQIIIENKELKQVLDSSLVTNDDILRSYLNTHADDKMKDIIASIQKEQNSIIRKPLNKNLLVQGIAGSGKTSVALHRIAYLIYQANEIYKNYNKNVRSNQFMIIGPNTYFLDYISEVLPDMDIDNVNQSTLVTLTKDILNEKIKILDNNSVLSNYFDENKNRNDQNLFIKTSTEYENALKIFLNDYIYENLRQDFKIDDVILLDNNYIKNRFENVTNLQDSISDFINLYSKKIKDNYDEYEEKLNRNLREKMRYFEAGSEEKKILLEKIKYNSEILKRGLKKELQIFFKKILSSSLDIYIEFISNIDKYMYIQDSKKFKETNLAMLNKKNVTNDDLASLLYIKSALSNIKKYQDTLHVVIDEAQDLSLPEFNVLRKIFPSATFSIFGDMNQSIYPYRSITGWEEVGDNTFEGNYILTNLNRSYRTTDEIITEANKISKLLNGDESLNNVRHGADVIYEKIDNNSINNILLSINEMLEDNCHSIAVITKTEKEACELEKQLNKKGLKIKNVTTKDEKYTGGICILASYLAKGLEFDGTILYNVDNNNYDTDDKLDMALLYVSMTRPLHKLKVLYENELPAVLTKNKVKVLGE